MALAALAVTMLVATLAAGEASADKRRIVVLDFSGPRAAAMQREVVKVINGRHVVIPGKRYTQMARKLKATKPSDANVAKVAAKLEADGIVLGQVKRRGKRYELEVRVRAGKNGAEQGTVELVSRKITRKERRQLQRDLLALIDELPERQVEETPVVEDVVEEEERKRPVVAEAKGSDDSEVPDEVAHKAARPRDGAPADPRERAIDIAAGLSFTGRSLEFSVRDGVMDPPQGYDGAVVAGAFVAAEVYPMAFGKGRSFLRNIGITGVFDQVIKIESRLAYLDMTGQPAEAVFGTEQARWGAGLVYRLAFGSSRSGPTLKVGVGYNQLAFVIDKAARPADAPALDIPNVSYSFLDPGLSLRYPLTRKLALMAAGHYLLFTGAGEIELPEHYGGGSITGFDATLELEYKLLPRLSIRAAARIMDIAFDFDGTGALLERDGDAATEDVGGAVDRYLGGHVVAGYEF